MQDGLEGKGTRTRGEIWDGGDGGTGDGVWMGHCFFKFAALANFAAAFAGSMVRVSWVWQFCTTIFLFMPEIHEISARAFIDMGLLQCIIGFILKLVGL